LKREIFGILSALVLVVSFSLVTAQIEVTDPWPAPSWSVTGLAEGAVLSSQQQVGYVTDASNQPDYLYPEPASIVSPIVPNDMYFDKQWALIKIQASEAWKITSGSQDILIAVLDTGIDQRHEDLADKVVANVNFTDSPTTADCYGHGTHIAGIIAASNNNSLGIAGLAPNCRLVNIKVADDDGICNSSSVARGIIWAVDNGAKVINIGLTLTKPAQALEDAVDYAWSKGAILVAAAGSNGGSTPVYPAYYANCLAVTATDSDDLLGQLARYGDWVDMAAPGVNIYSTLPGNGYGYKSGTSMATAHVAGVAGLLLTVVSDANGNGLLNDEARHTIENSCDEIGIPDVTKGRINAFKAIAQATDSLPDSATGRVTGLRFGESELFAWAGYLFPQHSSPVESEMQLGRLNPYVAAVLSREPVEIQRAVVATLSILTSIARGYRVTNG